MANAFVDRRRKAGPGPTPHDDSAAIRAGVRESLGLDDLAELPDLEAGRALVEAAAEPIVARAGPCTSRAVRSWATAKGVHSRAVVRPSRSRRDGAQADPVRNVRAYLLVHVLGFTGAELGREIGLTRSAARAAALAGARTIARARAAGMTRPD